MNSEQNLKYALILLSVCFLGMLVAYIRLKRSSGTYIRHPKRPKPKTEGASVPRPVKPIMILALLAGLGVAALSFKDDIGTFFTVAIHPKEVLVENIAIIKGAGKNPKKKPKAAPKRKTRSDGTVERRTVHGATVWAAPDAKFDPGGKGKLVPLSK